VSSNRPPHRTIAGADHWWRRLAVQPFWQMELAGQADLNEPSMTALEVKRCRGEGGGVAEGKGDNQENLVKERGRGKKTEGEAAGKKGGGGLEEKKKGRRGKKVKGGKKNGG